MEKSNQDHKMAGKQSVKNKCSLMPGVSQLIKYSTVHYADSIKNYNRVNNYIIYLRNVF